jgi:hypothetical protein
MINFRFHLVSLIAVFLALAVGVVMGSTVIDQAIVDGLRSQLKRVENKADDARQRNEELEDELDRLGGYVEGTSDFAVTGRLDGVAIAVLALRGSGDDAVKDTVTLAQTAGALVPGVLWLEETWLLDDEETRGQLAEVVGEGVDDREDLRSAAWSAIASRLAAGNAAPGSDVLEALAERGFLTFEPVGEDEAVPLDAYPGAPARVLLVDGADVDEDLNALLAPAARAFVGASVPLVVAEVYRDQEDGPGRGARVLPVQQDDLAAAVSTVDDLDLEEGRVTAVLALAELGRGRAGRYGYGAGAANGSLPEWTPT